MPGIRPEGPEAGSDAHRKGLETPAEAMFNIAKQGNEPPAKLISAAC
jgi:hypothetical protein